MNQHAYIYAIRHNVTGKVYIGSSSYPQERYRHHINRLRRGVHSVEDLQADFDKYGEAFTFRILEEVPQRRPTGVERRWMHLYQTRDRRYGYNYKDPTTKGRCAKYAGQEPEGGRLIWEDKPRANNTPQTDHTREETYAENSARVHRASTSPGADSRGTGAANESSQKSGRGPGPVDFGEKPIHIRRYQMNTITIELCAEDRARLDRIAESMELLRGPIVVGPPIPLDPQPEPTPQDLTPETVTSDVQAVVDTQPEPAAEPEPVKEPEPKKATTPADVMAVLQPMLAPGSKKRATAREIVLKYAPKVSAIPTDKLDEVLGRLKALADDMEAGV